MSETNVGANLVFALRTTIVCEPMSEAMKGASISSSETIELKKWYHVAVVKNEMNVSLYGNAPFSNLIE